MPYVKLKPICVISAKMRTFSSSMLGLCPSVVQPCAAAPDQRSALCNYRKMGLFVAKRVSGRGKEMQDEDKYKGTRKEKRGPGTQHPVYIRMEWQV